MNTKPYNMDEAIGVFAGSLYGKLLLVWCRLPRARQEELIRKAFADGIITHKRGDDERLH
jgi:hypothetical protein